MSASQLIFMLIGLPAALIGLVLVLGGTRIADVKKREVRVVSGSLMLLFALALSPITHRIALRIFERISE
jgi:energy-coupling factor transporter transmembrane protein EcfT